MSYKSKEHLLSFPITFNQEWLNINQVKFINHPENKKHDKFSFLSVDSYYDEVVSYKDIDYTFYDFLVGEIRTLQLDLYIDDNVHFPPPEDEEDYIDDTPQNVRKIIAKYYPSISLSSWKNDFIKIIKSDLVYLKGNEYLLFLIDIYKNIEELIEKGNLIFLGITYLKSLLIFLKNEVFYAETIRIDLISHSFNNLDYSQSTFTFEEILNQILNISNTIGTFTLLEFLSKASIGIAPIEWLSNFIKDQSKNKSHKIYIVDSHKEYFYTLINTINEFNSTKYLDFFNDRFLCSENNRVAIKVGAFYKWKSKYLKTNKVVPINHKILSILNQ